MLINALAKQAGMTSTEFNSKAASEIRQIAQKKFRAGNNSSSSTYGKNYGDAEYIAEAFLHSTEMCYD